jgi:uncharacterized membrane protein YhaH (DUF805 family)
MEETNNKKKSTTFDLFSFDGRISNKEYLISLIIFSFLLIGIMIINSKGNNSFLSKIITISLYWSFFAQGAKRCHDLGKNGFWQLIPFYFIFLVYKKGDKGVNKYGENPSKVE